MESKESSKLLNFIKKHWKLILAIVYAISPIDLLPESVLSVFGFADDLIVAIILIFTYLNQRQSEFIEEAKANAIDDAVEESIEESKKAPTIEGEIVE